ncbi:MAG TPA: hypothetical protein VEX13_03365 [Chloroflexia bacterium]|nr:hypothetical protein [Chloroflexia bacterium]
MNPHAQWRLELARRIAPAYSGNPSVRAVAVHGSAARGYADKYSDIEIVAFWDRSPTDEERVAAVEEAGGNLWNLYPFEDENNEWSEEFDIRGVKIDMSHRTVEGTETWFADVIERYDTDLTKHDMISVVRRSYPLYGAELIEQWRARTDVYPDELARLMVSKYLDWIPAATRVMAAARGELIPLYENISVSERHILLVLLALNRIYLPHLAFKWTEQVAAELGIAPPGLAARLRNAFLLGPEEGVRELHSLIEDTVRLVEQHMPEVDTSKVWARHRFNRGVWDRAPE